MIDVAPDAAMVALLAQATARTMPATRAAVAAEAAVTALRQQSSGLTRLGFLLTAAIKPDRIPYN